MTSKKQQAATATPESDQATTTAPASVQPRHLPQYKVILHNDDENDILHVVETILMLTPLGKEEAIDRTREAHFTGCSLLLVIHRERAELYVEQFQSRNLTVTIEPAE
ncbi:MAG: ATP-dependent Clp protease adaptor ClpS [Phycisphaerae bacterium]